MRRLQEPEAQVYKDVHANRKRGKAVFADLSGS